MRLGGAKIGSSEDPGRICGVRSCMLGVGGVRGRQRWRSSEGHDLGGVTAKTKGGSSVPAACWCLQSQRPPSLWPTQGTDPSPAVTCHISWFRVSVPDSVNGLSGVGRAFWRDSWSVWKTGIQGLGDVQGSETVTFFVCRGREVFPWVREYCGEGLQSMGPPLISLDWPEGISDSSTLVQQRFVFPFSW